MSDRLLDIIEDRQSLDRSLTIILRCIETRELPDYCLLPCFHDTLLYDEVKSILEGICGKKYE